MNAPSHTTFRPGCTEREIVAAADELNRGIAMVNTVWLALRSAETDHDIEQAADSLYEAMVKLALAQKTLGLYHPPAGAS